MTYRSRLSKSGQK